MLVLSARIGKSIQNKYKICLLQKQSFSSIVHGLEKKEKKRA